MDQKGVVVIIVVMEPWPVLLEDEVWLKRYHVVQEPPELVNL